MKLLRSLTLAAVVAATMLTTSARAESTWLVDLKEAQQKAKSENKLLLLNFTGSDWCGWCIKLQREVFTKPEFKEYADKNLVLLEVDFPRRKTMAATVQQQNEQLAQKFQVEAFPTLVVLNSDGKPLGALSYDSAVPAGTGRPMGSPETFIANIEKLRKG